MRQAEYALYHALTVSWNAIIRARGGAVAEDPGIIRRWGLIARHRTCRLVDTWRSPTVTSRAVGH